MGRPVTAVVFKTGGFQQGFRNNEGFQTCGIPTVLTVADKGGGFNPQRLDTLNRPPFITCAGHRYTETNQAAKQLFPTDSEMKFRVVGLPLIIKSKRFTAVLLPVNFAVQSG